MKIRIIDLLPPQTRILLKEELRRSIFSNKKLIVEKLGVSKKTINNWIKGVFRPTLSQLHKLEITLTSDEFFENIEGVGLEK